MADVEAETLEIPPEDIVEERYYTVPLRSVRYRPRKKRAAVAVRKIVQFIVRHMKPKNEEGEIDPRLVKIHPRLNELIWRRGIEKPPLKVRVRAVRTREGTIWLFPA